MATWLGTPLARLAKQGSCSQTIRFEIIFLCSAPEPPAKREAAFGFAVGDTRHWEPWVGVPLLGITSRSLGLSVPQFPQLQAEGYTRVWEEKSWFSGHGDAGLQAAPGQEVPAGRSPSPLRCGMPLAAVSSRPSWPGPTGRRFH